MNLITLSEYKNYRGIKSTDNDSKLMPLISIASEICKNFCGRTFVDHYTTPLTQYFKSAQDQIFLSEFPIKEIVSITNENGSVECDVDYDIGHLTASGSSFGSSNSSRSLTVTYTGGYHCTPKDVQIACMDLVTYYDKEEYIPRRTQDTSSMIHISSQDYTMLPPHVRRILEMYRILL